MSDDVPADEDTLSLARRYVKLRARGDDLELRGKAVKEEADQLEKQLMDAFAQMSVERLTIDGKTIYLHRQVWASAQEGHAPDLIAALDEEGLDHMAMRRLNSNTLSALVREYEREERPLPAAVIPHLKLTERYTLRTRRAG